MNVTCPDCRTVYRVDPRKIPTGGVVARCARCPAEFTIESESELTQDALNAQAVVDPAAVAAVASGGVEGLEQSIPEDLPAAELPTESGETPASVDWVEPTAAEVTMPPAAEVDRSWLVQGSAWVDEISARMDEPAPATGEILEGTGAADLEVAAVTPEHDDERVSVTIDYNPEASEAEVSSEGQYAPEQQEPPLAGVETDGAPADYRLEAPTADADLHAEAAQYEDVGDGAVHVGMDGSEAGMVGAYADDAETREGGAAAYDGGAGSDESSAGDHEAVPAAAGGDYGAYEGGQSSYDGHDSVPASLESGFADAPGQEAAVYEGAAQSVSADADASRGSPEADGMGAEAEGHQPVEYGEPAHEHAAAGGERDGEWTEGASASDSPAYSSADAQERVEVEVVGEASAEEDQQYAAAVAGGSAAYESTAADDERSSVTVVGAMPDPPRQDPSSSETWAESRPEMARTDEPASKPSGVTRDREAVLVSANAGSLDAVAGVEGGSGGEGFTSVPPRSDEDIPLPPPPFGSTDPHARAKRLARALVSDIVVYNPDRRERSIRMGTVRQEFREEIRKSWEEYVAHVGNQMARDTSYFRDALNELLAGGNRLF